MGGSGKATYDNFGRLLTTQYHGTSIHKLTYAYNLRSWLTGLSGTCFTQNLYYNTEMCIRDSYYYDVKGRVTKVVQNNLLGGYDAVSYTHLDVYKRQVYKRE